jgi:Xaa-Pro aminopeptidase
MSGYLETLRQQGIAKELAFPVDEYRARIAQTRHAMARRGLDVLLVHHVPNICYLTGYQSPATESYTCLAIAQDRRQILQLVEHEIPGAELTSWLEELRPYRWYQPEGIPAQTTAIVHELTAKRHGMRIGVELARPSLPVAVYEALRQALPGAAFVDASDLVYAQRVVKSASELAYLRESGRITVLGINAALDAVRPGCTDNDVARAGKRVCKHPALCRQGSDVVARPYDLQAPPD